MPDSIYWLLFSSGLLSSTLLPGNSELVFAGLLYEYPDEWLTLLIAVTLGNTLGGLVSWGMGRWIAVYYPVQKLSKPGHEKAIARIQRWGSPALLLSWVPVVGDPLCIAAGWLKTGFFASVVFILLGKLLRYAMIAAAFL